MERRRRRPKSELDQCLKWRDRRDLARSEFLAFNGGSLLLKIDDEEDGDGGWHFFFQFLGLNVVDFF